MNKTILNILIISFGVGIIGAGEVTQEASTSCWSTTKG